MGGTFFLLRSQVLPLERFSESGGLPRWGSSWEIGRWSECFIDILGEVVSGSC